MQLGFGHPGPGLVFFPQTVPATVNPHIVGSGAPVATLSLFASGVATQTFNAAGTPVASLSKTASGAASQKFTASGAAVKTLSLFASGAATQKFSGSGAALKTLSLFAAGLATNTPDLGLIIGFGAPVATLSAFASGTATNTPKGSAPAIVIGWVEEKKKRKRKKLPPFEIPEKLDPEFLPLPELEPTRKLNLPNVTDRQHSPNVTVKAHESKRRQQREEQDLIHMIMAGAA